MCLAHSSGTCWNAHRAAAYRVEMWVSQTQTHHTHTRARSCWYKQQLLMHRAAAYREYDAPLFFWKCHALTTEHWDVSKNCFRKSTNKQLSQTRTRTCWCLWWDVGGALVCECDALAKKHRDVSKNCCHKTKKRQHSLPHFKTHLFMYMMRLTRRSFLEMGCIE